MPSFERKGTAIRAPHKAIALPLCHDSFVTCPTASRGSPPPTSVHSRECIMDRLQNSFVGRTFAQLYEITHATSRGAQIVLFRKRIKSLDLDVSHFPLSRLKNNVKKRRSH